MSDHDIREGIKAHNEALRRRRGTRTALTMDTPAFDRKRHIKYFSACLRYLPGAYDRLDTNRLTLIHFAVHSLDLLYALPSHNSDQCLTDEEMSQQIIQKQVIIDWIYSLQLSTGGFVGGTFLGPDEHTHTPSHVAMTYTALCTLSALGDDLSRVDKVKAVASLKTLQRPDGSFQCIQVGSEHDMRFLYCACVISYLLNDWSAIDKDRAVGFVGGSSSRCSAAFGGSVLVATASTLFHLCSSISIPSSSFPCRMASPAKAIVCSSRRFLPSRCPCAIMACWRNWFRTGGTPIVDLPGCNVA